MYANGEPIEVGNQKQLFLDETFFASAAGVKLSLNCPTDAGTAIRADRPWKSAHPSPVGPAERVVTAGLGRVGQCAV